MNPAAANNYEKFQKKYIANQTRSCRRRGKIEIWGWNIFSESCETIFSYEGFLSSLVLVVCFIFAPKDSRAFAHVIVKQEEGGKVEDHPYVQGLVVGPG